MPTFVASIDHGTTSTRFIVFDKDGAIVAQHQIEFEQIHPKAGSVPAANTPQAAAHSSKKLTSSRPDGTSTIPPR